MTYYSQVLGFSPFCEDIQKQHTSFSSLLTTHVETLRLKDNVKSHKVFSEQLSKLL